MLTFAEQLGKEMRKARYNQTMLSQKAQVSLSAINRALSGVRIISFAALTQITSTLELPEDFFYESYFESCWNQDRERKEVRYVLELAARSVVLGKMDFANKIYSALMETGKYLGHVFDFAEELFSENRFMEALFFYKRLVKSERNFQSNRLAMIYYRLFLLHRDNNLEQAFHYALLLSPHIEKLKEEVRHIALNRVVSVLYILEKWDLVEELSEELATLTKDTPNLNTYGIALLYLAIAARMKGDYKRAKQLINNYGSIIVGMFSRFAEGNSLIVSVEEGNIDALYDLYLYAKKHPDRAIGYLDYLFEKSVELELDGFVEKLLSDFPWVMDENMGGRVHSPIELKREIRIKYYIAQYWIKKNKYEDGINLLLNAMEKAGKIKMNREFHLCVLEIFKVKEACTKSQLDKYVELAEGSLVN